MRRCCFLTMDSLEGYVSDDELAFGPMRDAGWEVETVSWRSKSADWARFEIAVIRTTWDYQESPREFIRTLEVIEAAGVQVENSLDLVRWNLNKSYLKDLAKKGVKIVPTIFGEGRFGAEDFEAWLSALGSVELIIKPAISATAMHTYRLREYHPEISEHFKNCEYLIQPFLDQIASEGEYSLFYFGGEFSHAVLKVPREGDFRVQEEFGGEITSILPSDGLSEAGSRAMSALDSVPLYCRADIVRVSGGEFHLMELELIEPALYFRMDEGSARRFAAAIAQIVGRKRRTKF